MEESGVMEQLREVLSAGASPREAIAMGYAPGTVYTVNRQMERAGERGKDRAMVPVASPLGDRTRGEARAWEERLAGLEEEVKRLTRRETEQAGELKDLRKGFLVVGGRLEALAGVVFDLVFLEEGLPEPSCRSCAERDALEARNRLSRRVPELNSVLSKPVLEQKIVIGLDGVWRVKD